MLILATVEMDVLREAVRLAPTKRHKASLDEVAANTGHQRKWVGAVALYLEELGYGTPTYPKESGEPDGFRPSKDGLDKCGA